MNSLFSPGNSLFHRAPAGLKLLALAVGLLAISIWVIDFWSAAAVLATSIAALFIAGADIRRALSMLWGLKFLALFVFVPQLIFMGLALATINTCRLLACILFANLFTMTTRNQALLEIIETMAGPLKPLDLKPQTVALLVAMTLNSIAQLSRFVVDIREAQLARGIRPRVHRMAVPLLVKSLKHADDYAEALLARGVEV